MVGFLKFYIYITDSTTTMWCLPLLSWLYQLLYIPPSWRNLYEKNNLLVVRLLANQLSKQKAIYITDRGTTL